MRQLKAVCWVVLAVLAAALTTFIAIGFLWETSKLHWIISAIVTAFFAFGSLYLGTQELRSPVAQNYSLYMAVTAPLVLIGTGIAVGASTSYILQHVGLAVYEPGDTPEIAKHFVFAEYYFWVLLDMIPAVGATELLVFPRPVQPKNWVAGIPVVAFKAYIIFAFIAALKKWWTGWATKPDPALASPPG